MTLPALLPDNRLRTSTGDVYYLTLWDRSLLALGLTTVSDLDAKAKKATTESTLRRLCDPWAPPNPCEDIEWPRGGQRFGMTSGNILRRTAYERLLEDVLANGNDRSDRTKTGTRSVFGRQIRFDLREGFPLVTTKNVHFKSIALELLWFLRGDTNVKWLQERGCTIWNEWADENGDLGPVYGAQWRGWSVQCDDGSLFRFDQIRNLIHDLKNDPNSRRHVVSAWNVGALPSMALHPCHYAFQCYVEDGRLSLMWSQRST